MLVHPVSFVSIREIRANPWLNHSPMQQPIIDFEQDEVGDWRAVLACGHRQHVRHNPPLVERPWVLSAEGRARFVGVVLDCKRCDEEADEPEID